MQAIDADALVCGVHVHVHSMYVSVVCISAGSVLLLGPETEKQLYIEEAHRRLPAARLYPSFFDKREEKLINVMTL